MEALLTSTLRKVKKDDMEPLLLEWGRLDTADIDFEVNKSDCIEKLVRLCQKKALTHEDAAELDLTFYIRHSERRNWVAYELQSLGDLNIPEMKNLDDFKRTFAKNMRKLVYCDMAVVSHKKSFWCRISQPRASYRNALFLIFYPSSKYFLLSALPSKLRQFAIAAISKTLGAKNPTALPLSGRHPDSLAQILLHTSKDAQENYDCDDGQYLPKRRRVEPAAFPIMDGMILENSRRRDTNRKANEKCFGPYVQPALQNISIRLETKYRAKKVLPNMTSDTIIRGKVQFSGQNVMEGLRSLVSKNLAVPPIPNYLSQIGTIGKNNLVITEK